jgi:hypothetical protein
MSIRAVQKVRYIRKNGYKFSHSGIAGTAGMASSCWLSLGRCVFRFAICCARCSCSACICVRICICCAINSWVPGLNRVPMSKDKGMRERKHIPHSKDTHDNLSIGNFLLLLLLALSILDCSKTSLGVDALGSFLDRWSCRAKISLHHAYAFLHECIPVGL